MAEKSHPRALTTKERIKARLSIDVDSHDPVIDRLIAAVTDYLEGECNRKFKEATYTNEVYEIHGIDQKYVLLKQAPVTALTSFQYRAGTVSNPSWTNFLTDDYELVEDGKSGLIRVYGGLSQGTNKIRASYTAGYKISWDNVGDESQHTLPADLTDLAERLVTKVFKKREAEGKDTEAFEGGTVTWARKIDDIDKEVINRYRRLPEF